ncbi:MAG: DEAD/DEAH box helicase [Gemmatimonadota bacterium]|nr:MAG: DEAD/DEAH box helicase [Gemmatimonadota bacterium]
MESFEDLGLPPELVEALSAEGIEVPTAFQRDAIPVIRRGNNLAGAAGPGAGTLVAYATALLDRLEPGGPTPTALVVTPTAQMARELAESMAQLAQSTGHSVAALESPWALPERADVLFGSAEALLSAIKEVRLSLEHVQALVVDGAGASLELENIDKLLEFAPADAQRIVLSLPLTTDVDRLISERVSRSVHVPPRAVDDKRTDDGPDRGILGYTVAGTDKAEDLLHIVSGALAEDFRHVLVFFRSEDGAADMGDYLTLRGFVAGAPGDTSVPVWLAMDPIPGREAALELDGGAAVLAVSFDVPGDMDVLDRRHGGGLGGMILAVTREVPHLRQSAFAAGYRLKPAAPRTEDLHDAVALLRDRLVRAVEDEDLGPYFLMLEPLMERFSAPELAAASLALLQGRDLAAETQSGPAAAAAKGGELVRLFVSVGSRDDIGPGDLLGSLAGESGVDGSQFGRIEIRDTFSLVEVEKAVAEKVIKAVNGVTIRGRSTRVDYDRGGRAMRQGGPPRERKSPRGD